jgi:hypothetical protein
LVPTSASIGSRCLCFCPIRQGLVSVRFPANHECLCFCFEEGWVRSIKTPVSKSFRPRGFFVRNPRHPAKTRDVTPVFSATYAHALARAVSLPPTPLIENSDAGTASGAQIYRKSRPNQRHPRSGLYGAFPSRERFPVSQMERRVMGNGGADRLGWCELVRRLMSLAFDVVG